jgi:hypothetical protein
MALTPLNVTDGLARTVVLFLVGWNTFVIAYVALTLRTFGRVDSAQFRARMQRRGSKRGWDLESSDARR